MKDGNAIRGIYNAVMPVIVIILLVLYFIKKPDDRILKQLENDKKELIEKEKQHIHKIDSLNYEIEIWLAHYRNLQATYRQTYDNYERERDAFRRFRNQKPKQHLPHEIDSILRVWYD